MDCLIPVVTAGDGGRRIARLPVVKLARIDLFRTVSVPLR